jgi:hypothetical protein
VTPAEAAAILRELHPSAVLKVHQKNALVVAILLLEDRALADRAEDDTKPIEVPASVRMAMRGHR